jgi:hypothetical protein
MQDRPRYTHRTVNLHLPDYERQLATGLFDILSRGVHDLPGIVAALNGSNVRPPGGEHWTETIFSEEMQRLGAYPHSIGAPPGGHPAGVIPPGTSAADRLKQPDGSQR